MKALRRASGALAVLAAGPLLLGSGAADPFPEVLPSTRSQAVDALARVAPELGCVSPVIAELRQAPTLRVAELRALSVLDRRIALPGGRIVEGPDGVTVQFTTDPLAVDQVAPIDADSDGLPDGVQAAMRGVEQGRELFSGLFELPLPVGIDVVLVQLGPGTDGYTTPVARRPGRYRLVLSAAPEDGLDSIRQAAIHQYAHAVTLTASPRFPPAWSEAFATWATITADGALEGRSPALLSQRLARLDAGLGAADPALAAGSAAWLAFLNEAHGLASVRAAFDELAKGSPAGAAFESALARTTQTDLAGAFREFHLWALLVGDRADGHHFSFARALAAPEFAASIDGLPALAVHPDPPIAPLGATQIRLHPDVVGGGMRVHFEGEEGARWEADLVLVGDDGTLRRLALSLPGGRGETIVPAVGIDEAWLLVRRPGNESDVARRFSFAVDHVRGFPFHLAALDAQPSGGASALITWETESEQGLVGYNVIRVREDGGTPVAVNPVWIPALGDPALATSYQFLDRTVQPGVRYRYFIEGITGDGLAAPSDAVGFSLPPLREVRRAR